MCSCYTTAKIRKAFKVSGELWCRKKYPLLYRLLAYFCQNFSQMEMQKRNKGLYLILFLVAVALTALAIITHWPWLTLLLPFVFTFFVLAMDII
jgi:hypothetical protein